MKQCAFLTMADSAGFVIDDELAVAPLAELGWQVTFQPWRQTAIPWQEYDAVIIRSTWDYQNDPRAFLAVLEHISRMTQLENQISLVRWNMQKTYLRDLERRGIGIVPTMWGDQLTKARLNYLMDAFGYHQLIIKPVIGANADDTFLITADATHRQNRHALAAFNDKPFMAQPFMPAVIEEGEFSLFFFAGAFSHAILKTPQVDDFRVQEEHGGLIKSITAEKPLLQQAKKAVAAITPQPLYARVDMVRATADQFVVMELELIEPSLYLRMDDGAAARFAAALDWKLRSRSG